MNTASLELCKELYELSGWEQPDAWKPHWVQPANDTKAKWILEGSLRNLDGYLVDVPEERRGRFYNTIPAYDLGYILRKLQSVGVQLYQNPHRDKWYCTVDNREEAKYLQMGDTPEDAAVKLCIELFKQGVLK